MTALAKLPPGTWLLFTPDHDEDEAAEIFFRKHGYPPLFVHDTPIAPHLGGPRTDVLALGPVEGDKAE